MIIATHGIIASQLAGFDADAQAFFDRVTTAGGSLSATEKTAVNKLVLDLKGYSIWSKMKAIYPMVGASAAACAQNLKSASFTGTFTATGITYASTGVKGNGTSAYMDTGVIPSNDLSLNNAHLSFYSRDNQSAAASSEIGSNEGTANRLQITLKFTSNINYYAINNNVTQFDYSGSTSGFFTASRITSSQIKLYRNNTIIDTKSSTTQNLNSKEIIILGTNNDGIKNQWSTKECAFASIGDGLTDTEASNFYTAVQAFQTTLSRQVS